MRTPLIVKLNEPDKAWAFLNEISPGSAARGEEYLRANRIGGITCRKLGEEYVIRVDGTFTYEVSFRHDSEWGWDADCTCPVGCDCKHIYAAVKTLLTRSGAPRPAGTVQPTQPKVDGQRPVPDAFTFKVEAALKRPLEPEEQAYLDQIVEVFRRTRSSGRLNWWELGQVGLGGLGSNSPPLWPSPPKDVHEFWLYLAFALREQKQPIPEFLEPVTDLGPIEERVLRWRRAQEVDRWRGLLKSHQRYPDDDETEVAPAPHDLQVVIEKTSAALTWKRPGETEFARIKAGQLRDLADRYADGTAVFPPGAESILNAFLDRDIYSSNPQKLDLQKEEDRRNLSRLFRQAAVQDRIVSETGQPLGRPAQRLRWNLTEPPDPEGDYCLQVVDPTGQPLSGFRCILPGRPLLFLTDRDVYQGPPVPTELLHTVNPNLVPARALETMEGLALLQQLRVPLPPRLRERVREVPLRLHIRGELRAPGGPGRTEYCYLDVQARGDDGRVEKWLDSGWQTAHEPKVAKGRNRELVIYDRAKVPPVAVLLEALNLRWDQYQQSHYVRVTRDFPTVFADWLKSLPPEVKLELEGDLASLAHPPVSGSVRLEATEVAIDWFDLKVVLDVTSTELSPDELKSLLDARGKFVRLKDKGWRRLAFDLTEEDDERLARLGLSPGSFTAEPQRLHALQLADDAARHFLPAAQAERVHRRSDEIKARVTPAVPAEITATLRPYQTDGFHFLAYLASNRFGGILADDMGLGKTLQTLAWLVWLRHSALPAPDAASPAPPAGDVPSLVVCPKSVMNNWLAEAARFTRGLRVKTWAASELAEFAQRLGEADLHVINYSQLRLLGESLVTVQWRAVILDEGQYIKNPDSQTAQIARALRAEHRLVLTGTPIENRLLDLWSLMGFAMPGALGSRAHFGQIFDAKGDPFARRRLAARVRPFLLRRTKAQVAKDLPDRVEEDLYAEIEGEQQTLYRAELKRAQQMLLRVTNQQQLNQERFNFLTSLLRLRQICCHPALVKPGSKAASAKLDALIEQLEPLIEEGHKALVFSQFVGMLELIRAAVTARGWPHFFLSGETENRGKLIDRFQSTDGAAVFLLSLKAGGFGLNLTAASYVFLFDPWWNPAVENQAIDRTHRIGQTRTVIAYRLLIKDSIEDKIRALQKQKSALAEDVLGEEKFAQALTLDDLRYLFAD